ncbi:methylmalonyl-CoA mutase subunit beta [Cellulophaga sp. F20128]|uniref:methylmalonyl-CoA mutase subunit beta n=1 Tax=Cellulophaga sp. F20128 TaxID=2926413 RepID=UPI001FF5327C|nr:methylmalonyl-CoA mutase subunit beta [Cellulophaga sp. F20128]MCK0157599.1 methylmalonyl-CoA mutase subunit beta [Cellulophaga sp. F20128]
MSKKELFKEFSEVSAKEWKQKIQFDLKGADYNEALIWESPEGIKVKPFYNSDDITDKIKNHTDTPKWNIGQPIFVQNETASNLKALDSLERGAEDLVFTISSAQIKIDSLLKSIPLKNKTIYFYFQFISATYIKNLIEYCRDKDVTIHLNIDIIGNLAKTGNWYTNLNQDHKELDTIVALSKNLPWVHTMGVDVSTYQNAGATMAQQLAYALAHANEYLNHYKEGSIPKFTFTVSISGNYFFEIAKLRALRLLWNTLAEEYNTNANCTIIASPSKRNKTLYDYNVNLLRTTTECMAACLGGANTICNLAYDAIYHKDNEFGERISRNQLLILKKESYFEMVSNPADGAYYIESITHQLAEKALELFKSIEAKGGFLSNLKSHYIQKKIKESALKEQELFNNKKEILVGTNKYENPADRIKGELELYPFVKTNARKTLLVPIIEKRLAEELEQKRLQDE